MRSSIISVMGQAQRLDAAPLHLDPYARLPLPSDQLHAAESVPRQAPASSSAAGPSTETTDEAAASLAIVSLSPSATHSGVPTRKRKATSADAVAEVLEEYRSKYASYSHDELVREILRKDRQHGELGKDTDAKDLKIKSLARKVRSTQQQLRRCQAAKASNAKGAQSAKAKSKARAKSMTLPAFLRVKKKMEIVRTGCQETGTGRYLTVPSRVSLAIRRNLSNVSCADLGLVVMEDASRFSIARAQVHTGAAAIASVRKWYDLMQSELFHQDGANDFNLSVHVVSQDATNSGIWQKRKLVALLCHSAYLAQLPSSGNFKWNFEAMFEEFRAIADVQPVEDATGQGSVAGAAKMLRSIGCPTVHDLVQKHAGRLDSTAASES